MRDELPSRTAAFVAAARFLGRTLPIEAQLADDPYGAAFTARWLSRRLEHRTDTGRLELPWLIYMQVRTRVLDDAVRAFVAGGGRQLVLLGAGYDCRALRLTELAGAGARVFEVDHPATQGHKRKVLERIHATSPSTYVTWDFETRPTAELPDALADAGLDRAAPVLTIWEGVTMYLTEPAIDASLRAIHAYGGPGSQLAMTYFARSRLTKPTLITRAIKAVVARMGEPWRFGWDPEDLPNYLDARGLTLTRDVAMADAARELLPAGFADKLTDPTRRIAISAIASAPEKLAFSTQQ